MGSKCHTTTAFHLSILELLLGLAGKHVKESFKVQHGRWGPVPGSAQPAPAWLATPACLVRAAASHPCQYTLLLLWPSRSAWPVPICACHPWQHPHACLLCPSPIRLSLERPSQPARSVSACVPHSYPHAHPFPNIESSLALSVFPIAAYTSSRSLPVSSVLSWEPRPQGRPSPPEPPCAPSSPARSVRAPEDPRGRTVVGGSPPPSPPPGSGGPRPRAPPCPAGPGGAVHPAPLAEAQGRPEAGGAAVPLHHGGAPREQDGRGAAPGHRCLPARPRPGAPRRRTGKAARGSLTRLSGTRLPRSTGAARGPHLWLARCSLAGAALPPSAPPRPAGSCPGRRPGSSAGCWVCRAHVSASLAGLLPGREDEIRVVIIKVAILLGILECRAWGSQPVLLRGNTLQDAEKLRESLPAFLTLVFLSKSRDLSGGSVSAFPLGLIYIL